MPRPASKHPTELELAILKILWKKSPASVREVREALDGFRKLAYTSVMTIMNIMTRKKYLKRIKKGKTFAYTPLVSETETTRGILTDIVERLFDGSTATAMLNLLETSDIDKNELIELKKLINSKGGEE